MTEQEWLVSTDSAAMLRWLTLPFGERPLAHPQMPVSDRKLRLFACACCRLVWDKLTTEAHRRVGGLEVAADGGAYHPLMDHSPYGLALQEASILPGAVSPRRNAECAALLRDIFGNPWQSVQIREEIPSRWGGNYVFVPRWLAWNGGLIPRLAQDMYDRRDFSDMAVLGDALEEAGCSNEDMLRHCRQKEGDTGCPRCDWTGKLLAPLLPRGWQYCPHCCNRPVGPHTRGCWVIDLLLGKE